MAASVTPVLGAAGSAVLPLLVGAVREGTVLGVFSRAVVVGLHTESGPRVVSLLGRGAAAVPNGVRLAGADFPVVRAGAAVAIGAGWVRVGDLEVRVVRSWSTRVPAVRPDGPGIAMLATAAASAERGVPSGAISRLHDALTRPADGDHDLAGAVDGLVGHGRGLTPGGDDVLAGALTGLHAAGLTEVARTIGGLVLPRITERTTLVSADLLRLAAASHACLEALAVLRAIHRSGSASTAAEPGGAGAPVTAAINRLLAVGHTSGADLASGLAMGLTVRLAPEAALAAAGQGAR
jgi:hypothetical protein